MSDSFSKHKLTAILYADVAGYSRLTSRDEMSTHQRVTALLDFASESIGKAGGTVLRYAGDAILAESASILRLVSCAVAIQRELADRNAEFADDDKVQIRIGLNIGEVLQDRGEIYGDGVNLAARLEAAAAPGGICISAAVHDQVKGKLEMSFVDGGMQNFKNIESPVRVYFWTPGASKYKEPAELALPSKPSIAILAFENMSHDPEQDFFADGIAEDIITELSKFRTLFVIARNSSFSFKNEKVTIKEVGAKLGVRYVVEGSVRKAGGRVRITAQLIDAVEDKHLWAERYDRDLEDIFAVQDEVTQAIVTAIEPHLATTERQRARRKPTGNLDAWECYQRGLWYMFGYDQTDQALHYFERTIELDSQFGSAYAGIAYTSALQILLGSSENTGEDLKRGLSAAETALSIDQSDPFAHFAQGRILLFTGDQEKAISAFKRAIALNPSYALAHFGLAHGLWHAGRPAEALAHHDEAIRLSPHDVILWAILASKAIALVMAERFEEGVSLSREAQRNHDSTMFEYLGELSGLGMLGKSSEAADALERLTKVQPDVSISYIEQALPIAASSARDRFFRGLELAGLS